MLYLESLILHKFKSFKHAELLFSKGFTCVVGPNGSGKSNIMDAILIAFGESSMNRLRIEKEAGLGQLIFRNTPHARLAYITLNFSGDEKIAITKVIRNDGKTKYRVNGKRMTRKEVIELLAKYNVRADETTTIAQEEISTYTRLNPKQRRELIDIAAGIKEFEYKKGEALKELDKVGQKANLEQSVLHERIGFLKELEKEKDAAEHYAQMSAKRKSLRYSILFLKKEETKSLFEKHSKDMALLDSKKNDAVYKVDEFSKKIDNFSQENQHLTNEMNKSNSTMSETNAKRESVSKELTRIEAEILSQKNTLAEAEKAIETDTMEKEQIAASIKANGESAGEFANELSSKQAQLLALEQEIGEDDLGKVADSMNKLIDEDESKLVELNAYISKLQSDEAVARSRQNEAGKRREELNASIKEKEKQIDSISKGMDGSSAEIEKLSKEISKMEGIEKGINGKLEEIDTKLINTREQLALAQPRENALASKISEKFDEKRGFYGKAAKLCTYDSKHGLAVEVSAGNRFEYFVVDSIDTANKIIRYLKENNLGRATFMPIEELRIESEPKKVADAKPLIELISFDEKHRKVFEYVFSNTYLINNVDDSKRLGIGKHRYVTEDGELIEQSGIISGGSQKRISSARLENELASLAATKTNMREQLEQTAGAVLSARKEHSKLELSIGSAEGEIRRTKTEKEHEKGLLSSIELELRNCEADIEKTGKELAQSDKERMELAKRLATNKNTLKEQISRSAKMSKSAKLTGKFHADAEKAKALGKELEALRIRIAELQKENQLLEKRAEALSNAIKDREKLIKETKHELGEKAIRKEVLDKARVDIEYSIMHSNESNKKALTRISELNKELEAFSKSKGALSNEVASLERQINDIKIERGKAETKFNDITAELAGYGSGLELVKGNKTDEMESEANILDSKIAELGNVNMKAPELYSEKKKSVDEAQARLNTLETEKNAVLRMINEIDSKKMQTFLDTLNEINKNFMKLYNYVFPGKATLMLEDPKDPLNSGLKIHINNGDIEQSVVSKSGGERAFISMMLIFAIHSCKPSSLYIFDEIDKSLDKENSKKLSLLIKQMSKDAQFIVITHNDALIVNADVAIGVTKVDEASKALGLDLSRVTTNTKQ